MICIDILIKDSHWPTEHDLHSLAMNIVSQFASHLPFMQDVSSELSLVFTSDAEIRQLNQEWRFQDKATNVLSFPAFPIKAGEKPKEILGDILFAYQTIACEAQQQNKLFEHHVSHLLVHGLLHLLGYDHIHDPEAEIMEQLERNILHHLSIPDPYPTPLQYESN